jgi:hypothetical protein
VVHQINLLKIQLHLHDLQPQMQDLRSRSNPSHCMGVLGRSSYTAASPHPGAMGTWQQGNHSHGAGMRSKVAFYLTNEFVYIWSGLHYWNNGLLLQPKTTKNTIKPY